MDRLKSLCISLICAGVRVHQATRGNSGRDNMRDTTVTPTHLNTHILMGRANAGSFMTRIKRALPALPLCLLLLLSACGGNRGTAAVIYDDAPVSAAPLDRSPAPAPAHPARPGAEEEALEILSLPYELGPTGGGDSAPLRGWLSLPAQGDGLPLVIVLHGNHNSKDPDGRFYEGFSYLTDALAGRGWAAVSLDLQDAYRKGGMDDGPLSGEIAGAHLEALKRADGGEALFPTDLTGRLDLGRVVVVGHSRGGDAALELACQREEVIAACAVAPNLRRADKEWRDIPMAVLVPAQDGDVGTLDGYAYLDPRYEAGLHSVTALTLLEGANHNYFNAKLTLDDAERTGGAGCSPEQQRDFLCRWLGDFCGSALAGDAAPFGMAEQIPLEMYGLPVRNLCFNADMALLTDSGQAAAVSSGCRTRRIGVDSKTNDLRIPLSWGTGHALTFWELSWDQPGGVADLPLRGGDLSGFERLVIALAPIGEEAPEGLSIALTDEAGHSAVAGLPKLEPLSAGDGYTVFAGLSVPLSAFQGVDLGQVARLSFTAERGAVWAASVWAGPASHNTAS